MNRNQYSDSFKAEAVKLALSGELTYAEVARDLGVNYKTLCLWIRKTMSTSKPSESADKNHSKQDYQALERQNRDLQKELDLRKREIEFLSLYAILCKLPSSQMAAQAVIKVYRKPIHGQSPILNRHRPFLRRIHHRQINHLTSRII